MNKLLALIALFLVAFPVAAQRRRAAVVPSACVLTVSPRTLSVPSGGGSLSIGVGESGVCAYTPTASDGWIVVTKQAGGVSVQVQANSATNGRTGTINIGGYVVTVTQEGSPIISPPTLPNLLTNGGFNTDLSRWTSLFTQGNGTATWQSSGIPTPPGGTGYVLINSTRSASVHQIEQCANVKPNQRYEVGTQFYIPSGQHSSGLINLALFELIEPDCTNVGYVSSRIPQVKEPVNVWTPLTFTYTTGGQAKSVLIVIGAGSNAPPYRAYFDDVYLREK